MQQFTKIVLSLVAIAGADAAAIERAFPPIATLTPYLAPLCKTADPIFSNLCTFNPVSLTQGGCQNIPNTCNIHYPASFTASLNQDNGGVCQVVVYSEPGCTGSPIKSGGLSTSQTGCVGSTYPGKLVGGLPAVGLVDGGQALPFGFQSAQLICGGGQ
ncbi:hypothetical protein PG985_015208 [Apiospora marii]|uniref:uncharacterized protein n=1 Tax=Apiospora marii TaxID=335849 RepID=UPI0031301D29